LDFSKAQPIQSAAPASGVTLDFSKAQPIQQGDVDPFSPRTAEERAQHGRVGNATLDFGQGAAQSLTAPFAHPIDSATGMAQAVAPDPGVAGLAEGLIGGPVGPLAVHTAQGAYQDYKQNGLSHALGSVAGQLALGDLGAHAIPAAADAAGAIKAGASKLSNLNPDSVQPVLQGNVRNVLGKVSQEAGVTPEHASSIRDVAGSVADKVKANSSALYQQLDEATGGRFQRFNDKLKNLNRAIRETVDEEEENRLLQRKAEVEASQEQALEAARQAGVDPNLISQAKLTWKQSQALFDLDHQLKMSAGGQRPAIAEPGSSPETLDPKKLFGRLNKLYDTGRLQAAVGEQNAQELLRHTDNAHLQQQKITNRAALVKKGVKIAATGAGIGAAGGLGLEAVGGH
jgi:hypothetical protein